MNQGGIQQSPGTALVLMVSCPEYSYSIMYRYPKYSSNILKLMFVPLVSCFRYLYLGLRIPLLNQNAWRPVSGPRPAAEFRRRGRTPVLWRAGGGGEGGGDLLEILEVLLI